MSVLIHSRFILLTLLTTRFTTPVIKKSLSPTWVEGTATFDFPIYLSMSDRLGVLELVVWDKDMLKKEYLGEVSVAVSDWFGKEQERAFGFTDSNNTVCSTSQLLFLERLLNLFIAVHTSFTFDTV